MERTVSVYVENMHDQLGDWFDLPTNLAKVYETLKVNDDGEIAITDYEAPFKIGEYDSLNHLNQTARIMDNAPDYIVENAQALIDEGWFKDMYDVIITYQDKLTFLPNIHDNQELGMYLIDHGYYGEVSEKLSYYIDYEKLGQDYLINASGIPVKGGYIFCQMMKSY